MAVGLAGTGGCCWSMAYSSSAARSALLRASSVRASASSGSCSTACANHWMALRILAVAVDKADVVAVGATDASGRWKASMACTGYRGPEPDCPGRRAEIEPDHRIVRLLFGQLPGRGRGELAREDVGAVRLSAASGSSGSAGLFDKVSNSCLPLPEGPCRSPAARGAARRLGSSVAIRVVVMIISARVRVKGSSGQSRRREATATVRLFQTVSTGERSLLPAIRLPIRQRGRAPGAQPQSAPSQRRGSSR